MRTEHQKVERTARAMYALACKNNGFAISDFKLIDYYGNLTDLQQFNATFQKIENISDEENIKCVETIQIYYNGGPKTESVKIYYSIRFTDDRGKIKKYLVGDYQVEWD